jgi:FKBP-type peptidyl-prolyl cis-trans isomerase
LKTRLTEAALGIAILAMLTACATAQVAAAPRKTVCDPPPKDLVVKDIKTGTGQAVRVRSAVAVGYTGWLYDGCKSDLKGAKFDTNEGQPAPFGFMVGAGRVIKGWDEGLIGMREKGTRLLIIPADKAYGNRAAGDKIPPNSTLVFEIDLHNIVFQPPGG